MKGFSYISFILNLQLSFNSIVLQTDKLSKK